MNLDVIGVLVVVLHLVVIGSIIVWFGLGMPKTWEKFRTELKKQVLGARPGKG